AELRMFNLYFFFFFSSRRRHTRSKRDWSSDVCSSDLLTAFWPGATRASRWRPSTAIPCERSCPAATSGRAPSGCAAWSSARRTKIGRASCRERVEISEVGGSVKEKRKKKRDNSKTQKL